MQKKEVGKNILKWAYILIVQSLQTVVIASIAIYYDRLYEFVFIVIGYQIGRTAFGRSYHAPTLIVCTVISALAFGLACAIVPTSKTSLIIQAILGVSIAYIMWLVEVIRIKIRGESHE